METDRTEQAGTDSTEGERAGTVERAEQIRRELEELRKQQTPVVCDNGKARPMKREFQPIQAVTAAELDKMELPPVEWLVDNILTVGLAALGAPPKSYKSFMALDLCTAICTGTTFLGFKTHQHACLYFDLESTKGRPKNRLNLILGKDTPKPDNLYIITGDDEPGRIGDGFETQVEYQLQQHPDIHNVVSKHDTRA